MSSVLLICVIKNRCSVHWKLEVMHEDNAYLHSVSVALTHLLQLRCQRKLISQSAVCNTAGLGITLGSGNSCVKSFSISEHVQNCNSGLGYSNLSAFLFEFLGELGI